MMSAEILHSIAKLRSLVEEIHHASTRLPKLNDPRNSDEVRAYLEAVTACANVLIYSRSELRDLDDRLAKSIDIINRDLAALHRRA